MTVGICSRCSQEPIFKVSSKSGQLGLRYFWYGQMSPGQMLPWQMSPRQMESVLNVHRNLPLKFHQNRVSNSWDIADVELWANVTWTNVAWTNVTMESVLDVSMNLHLKFHQNRVSNSWDNPDMDKCHLSKCCLDRCHCDCQSLF